MKKEIKFSLVYRDMWQSSGKYQPRADQLARIAPLIIEMGCFARVETNGGAFEQVNLLYGENPNKAVRTFTKPLHEVGIQTHMLDRGLNALRMYPVPADVRRLMYKVKHAQGVDITRIFCGLNEVRNIIPSIKYAKEAGMIPQATLCITYSPVHTVEYYSRIADQLIEAGAPEICLKDMAGIGRPEMLGQLVKNIKEKHPEVIVQYHGHTGPGLSMAAILEVCENDEKQRMAYCRYYRNSTYDNSMLFYDTEKYTHGIYKRKDYLDRLIEIYFTEQKIMMFFNKSSRRRLKTEMRAKYESG